MKCQNCKDKRVKHRTFGCPFICEACGERFLEAQAIMDVVFIWPIPKPKKKYKSSIIELPDTSVNPEDELRGRSHFGIVMSKGEGFWYDNGDFLSLSGLSAGDVVLYDSTLPNLSWYLGLDGLEHPIIRCGYLDIFSIAEFDEDEEVNNIKCIVS